MNPAKIILSLPGICERRPEIKVAPIPVSPAQLGVLFKTLAILIKNKAAANTGIIYGKITAKTPVAAEVSTTIGIRYKRAENNVASHPPFVPPLIL